MPYKTSSKPFCYIFILLDADLLFGALGLGLQLSQNTKYQHKMPGCTAWVIKNYNLSYDLTRN